MRHVLFQMCLLILLLLTSLVSIAACGTRDSSDTYLRNDGSMHITAYLIPVGDPDVFIFGIENRSPMDIELDLRGLAPIASLFDASGAAIPELPVPMIQPYEESRDKIIVKASEKWEQRWNISALIDFHRSNRTGFFIERRYAPLSEPGGNAFRREIRSNLLWVQW